MGMCKNVQLPYSHLRLFHTFTNLVKVSVCALYYLNVRRKRHTGLQSSKYFSQEKEFVSCHYKGLFLLYLLHIVVKLINIFI